MEFDYFTGRQAEQFAFVQIPKVLITDPRFRPLSIDAKLLYSIMLDRASLSTKNGWIDDKGRVYIIYTQDQIMTDLQCGNQKAVRIVKELEKFGLVEKKKLGQGKPALVYVKDFATGLDSENAESSHVLKCENHTSGDVEITSLDVPKSHTNNTDNNKTEINETESINQSALPQPFSGSKHTVSDGYDLMKKRLHLEKYLKDKLYYDDLLMRYPYYRGRIDEIFEILVEVLTSKAKVFRIAGEDMPAEVVKSRFMKLEYDHIDYILDCFLVQTTDIRNIKQYLLTTIYNAPLTIDHYYGAKAQYAMANWNEGEEL